MKVSSGAGFIDIAPPAPSGSGSATPPGGDDFGDAVRQIGEKHADTAAGKAAKEDAKADEAHLRKVSAAGKDDEKDKDESAAGEAHADPSGAAEVLGRLLAGAQGGAAGAAPGGSAAQAGLAVDADAVVPPLALDADGTTFDGALTERLVITPIGALGPQAAAGEAPGGKGAGGVALEVLHMETHFEPRADDFVIVEGPAAEAAGAAATKSGQALDGVLSTIRAAVPAVRDPLASGTGKTPGSTERVRGSDDASGVPMRFDEALARLTTRDGAASDTGGGSDRRGRQEASTGAATSRQRMTGVAEAADEGDGKVVALPGSKTAVADDGPSATVLPVGSMTSQIAGRVIDAFRAGSGSSQAADRPSGDTHLRLAAGGAALKTLTIQLQPENLGTLEVSMRLVDGKLTLELAASEHATAVALSHDRAGLKKLLEHAGFSMDEASISIVTRDATAAMARTAGSADSGGTSQGQAGTQGGDGGGAGRGAGASSGERGAGREGGRDASSGTGSRAESEVETPARRRSSVFL